MAEKLPVPNITIDENSSDYAAKIQQIADGHRTSIEAYNAQIDAGNIAGNALTKIAKNKADAIVEIDSAVSTAKTEIASAQAAIKGFQKNIVSVATGGTATIESEAGKIPLADETGKIDSKWLPATALMMSEANFEANRQINREKFDYKSGFVEMGKSYVLGDNFEHVNQGMWTYLSKPNRIMIGDDLTMVGTSKTPFAKLCIAGVDYSLISLNEDNKRAVVRFPDAPNGTVVYDSADGSTVDFTKDIDPKYGDVASNLNEAVARAFEGAVLNGDFRYGSNGWTTGNFLVQSVISGVNTITNVGNASGYIQHTVPVSTANVRVEIVISDATDDPDFYYRKVGGVISDFIPLVKGVNVIELTDADTVGSYPYFRIRPSRQTSPTASVKVHSFSVMPATQKVVTERIDMAGIEFYPEQITPTNPEVYPKGLIQSDATTINGISTKSSTTRPDNYYAVFDGDTASSHQNIDWFAATNEERATLAADPSNLIVIMANGDIVQWRARQRTIAGAGNGDWRNTSSIERDSYNLSFDGNNLSRVGTQGKSNTALPTVGGTNWYATHKSGFNLFPHQGLFTSTTASASYNGECYFLVLGTVPRLNQGAFHLSFNRAGCAGFFSVDGTNQWRLDWSGLSAKKPVSTFDCFSFGDSNTVGNIAPFVGKGSTHTDGEIIAGVGGRPDGRFYDAIYASGQGGFIDKRLSISNNLDGAISKRKSEDKNGTSRGGEKLSRSKPMEVTFQDGAFQSSGTLLYIDGVLDLAGPQLETGYLRNILVNGYPCSFVSSNANGQYLYIHISNGNVAAEFTVGTPVIFTYPTDITVSGEFNVIEVIGTPEIIRQCDDLRNGWFGYWNTNIEDSALVKYFLARKSLDSSINRAFLSDVGDFTSWTVGPLPVNEVENTVQTGAASSTSFGGVMVMYYTTKATITKESINPVVYRGEDGLGSVFVNAYHSANYGALLGESLSGIVVTSSLSNQYQTLHTSKIVMDAPSNMVNSNSNYPTAHVAIDIRAPSNNSPAVKSLWGTTEINGQLFPIYWWTELKYSTGSWNDDSLIHANDNTTTMTDLDGNTVLVGCAVGVDPIGWADKL